MRQQPQHIVIYRLLVRRFRITNSFHYSNGTYVSVCVCVYIYMCVCVYVCVCVCIYIYVCVCVCVCVCVGSAVLRCTVLFCVSGTGSHRFPPKHPNEIFRYQMSGERAAL